MQVQQRFLVPVHITADDGATDARIERRRPARRFLRVRFHRIGAGEHLVTVKLAKILEREAQQAAA